MDTSIIILNVLKHQGSGIGYKPAIPPVLQVK